MLKTLTLPLLRRISPTIVKIELRSFNKLYRNKVVRHTVFCTTAKILV